MKKNYFWAVLLLLFSQAVMAQRFTDKLDRGLVVIPTGPTTGSTTNLITWRRLSEEYYNVTYNLYKNRSLVKSGLTTTSYADNSSGLPSTIYQVTAVVNGAVIDKSEEVKAWSQYVYKLNNNRCATGYLDIALDTVYSRTGVDVTSNYSPNDAEFADLDGDGQLEMIIKRLNTYDAGTDDGKGGTKDMYAYNSTQFVVLDAYDINWQTGKATLLWRIDCGPNMVSMNSTEINIIAYDWDEDGKAEVVLRGADNMIVYGSDGKTKKWTVGDMSVNTRNNMTSHSDSQYAWTKSGNEYLIYMNGLTGDKYQVMDYPLKRLESNETNLKTAWGDDYGHRSTKHFLGAPVLDGRHASLFLGRGIYTRHKMIAMNLDKKSHTWGTLWTWNCNNSNSPWYGNGYHNYIIADVDEDGRDEIVYGSMVIDDNGKGLSTTGYGHGDAQHVSDFNPWRKGLEYFGCNEENPYWGCNYRDATTSKVLYKYSSTPSAEEMKSNSKAGDDGRCMMGNFSSTIPGCLGRSVGTDLISSVTNSIAETAPSGDGNALYWSHLNFRIYWDGDLGSEILDSPGTAKEAAVWDFENGRLFTSSNCNMNNDSKNNPCFQGDLIGDWREEIVVRCGTNVRIYTSGMDTNYSFPCLWLDHQYRQAMVWQMMAYNQPPHLSYFLGELEGYTVAPPPYSMQGRTEIANGGTISSSHNGQQIIACETNNMSISVEDGASPWVFYDNAPSWVQGTDVNGTTGMKVKNTWNGTSGDGSVGATNLPTINYAYYTHTVTGGAFTGKMNLVKQGDGTLVLPAVEQTYTGKTDIWAGTVEFNGSFSKSPVWMNRFTTFNTSGGAFNGGLTMEYASTLNVGGATAQSISNVTVSKLTLNYGARVVIDVNSMNDAAQNDQLTIGTLVINTKNWENGPQYSSPVLQINATKNLTGGRYPIGTVNTVTGDLSKWVIECSKAPADSYLELDGTTLYLVTGEAQMLEEPTIAITNMVKTGDVYYPQISVNQGNSGIETTKSFIFTNANGEETVYENKENTSLYSQNYEKETSITGWTTPGANISLGTGDGTYGNYFYVNTGGTNTRYAYTKLNNVDVSTCSQYVIEFDLALTKSNKENIEFCVMSKNGTMPSENWHNYATINSNANMLFDVTGGANSTTYTINGASNSTINSGTWYHYKLVVDQTAGTVAWTIGNGSSGTFTLPSGTSTAFAGFYLVAGRYYSEIKLDNIQIYEPAVALGDSFTFTEPGTLKVVLEADGFESSESTFEIVEPYVIKYESPAYNEINAADVATVLGEDYWNTTSYTSRWANWSKSNATYGEQYVMVEAKSTSGYVDKDKVVSINYVGSQYPTTLIEGFGIGHNKTNQPVVISADGLGDSYSIVYYKADNSWGGASSYDEGYQFADSEGHWSYTMSNNTFCKMIAWVRESLSVTYEMGDVNMDGYVDISDVVMLVNYILGSVTDAEAPGVLKYGDMDGSGSADISDVVAVVNKILN